MWRRTGMWEKLLYSTAPKILISATTATYQWNSLYTTFSNLFLLFPFDGDLSGWLTKWNWIVCSKQYFGFSLNKSRIKRRNNCLIDSHMIRNPFLGILYSLMNQFIWHHHISMQYKKRAIFCQFNDTSQTRRMFYQKENSSKLRKKWRHATLK